MGKHTSTQGNGTHIHEDEREINTGTIVDVRVLRTETYATAHSLSFALSTNPQMCERVVRELRAACSEIQRHLSEMERCRLTYDFATLIIQKRSVMNRFSLVKSDCYWANMDTDLSATLTMIDECHNALIGKFAEDFRLSDLLYMIDVFKKAQAEFEHKIEQVEEVLK